MAARVNIGKFVTRVIKPNSSGQQFLRWQKQFSTQGSAPPPVQPCSTSPLSSICAKTPLSQVLPGLPSAVYASPSDDKQVTQVTTLPNGLRVASEDSFGQFCTVGVVIDSGCRYEVAYPSGVSHFLEKLAFNSTSEFADRDKILQELEKLGGICDCQSSRDTFVYAASAETRGLDAVTKILGEIVLRPQISVEEMEGARQAIQFELETLSMRPEQESILMDMIHAAAYQDNTLGLPKICPSANIGRIDRETLFTFLSHHYTPSRMVIAGVGVKHEALLEAVSKYFVDQKPIWEQDTGLILPGRNLEVDSSVAQYTGGLIQEECQIPQFAGAGSLPELAHLVVGLEAVGHQDPDFIALCVLNMMMGGGGSFSAGGPGKGMYTRLYTNVLNRYHWMYNATAYNQAYSDTGLFCIHASAPPSHVREMAEVVVRELVNMAGSVGRIELERAKKQLQSMLLMNLEARPVVFEDIGRQVLATGHRKRPEYFMQEIGYGLERVEGTIVANLLASSIAAVKETDVSRVARRLLRSQPSVAARGSIRKLPSLADFQAGLMDEMGKMPSKLGRSLLFR